MARGLSPCIFCGRTNPPGTHSCAGCGGPLSPPVGADPGPPPPPAPRAIARRYIWRELFGFPIVWGVLFGGIPTAIGCVLFVVGAVTLLLPLMCFGPMFTSIFTLIGGAAMLFGLKEGWHKLSLLRHGKPGVARIVWVHPGHRSGNDTFTPWDVQYLFEVDGRKIGGQAAFCDPAASQFAPDDLMNVIYDPEDPRLNVPWPPP